MPHFDTVIMMRIFSYLLPNEVGQFMRVNRRFNQTLRDPVIWEDAMARYFSWELSRNKSKNINWLDLFKQTYRHNYADIPKRMRQLLFAMRYGNLNSLQALNFTIEDLYLEEFPRYHLIYYSSAHTNPILRNYIYLNHIFPFYQDNAHINLSKSDAVGFTLLHHAAAFGQLDALTLGNYTMNGAVVDAKSHYGKTPLYLAAQNGHIEGVKALIDAGADKHARFCGETPLFVAAKHGRIGVVNALIETQVNVNDLANLTQPLYIAAENGHIDVVKALLKAEANVDASQNGVTPLYIAAQNGNLEIVKELIKFNANMEARAPQNGDTPIFVAARYGHDEVVKTLAKAGADVNAGTLSYTGLTPLYIAVEHGHLEVVMELIKFNANVDAVHHSRKTLLSIAKNKGYTEIFNCLFHAKLNKVIANLAHSTVSNHSMTLYGAKRLRLEYSQADQLAAAMALDEALTSGDLSRLSREHSDVLESSEELAPLYQYLRK